MSPEQAARRPRPAGAAHGRLQPRGHALLPPDRHGRRSRGTTSARCSAPSSGGEFPPPRRLDPAIDAALEAVCLKAMAHRPEDRYATAAALAEDLERWAADEPVTAWREPVGRRIRRWARRHRTPLAVAGAASADRGRRPGRGRRRADRGPEPARPREYSSSARPTPRRPVPATRPSGGSACRWRRSAASATRSTPTST